MSPSTTTSFDFSFKIISEATIENLLSDLGCIGFAVSICGVFRRLKHSGVGAIAILRSESALGYNSEHLLLFSLFFVIDDG